MFSFKNEMLDRIVSLAAGCVIALCISPMVTPSTATTNHKTPTATESVELVDIAPFTAEGKEGLRGLYSDGTMVMCFNYETVEFECQEDDAMWN